MSLAIPIQVSKLKFDATESWWRHAGSDTELEYVIAGDQIAPSPRSLAMAESVLSDVSPFVNLAVDYLKQKLAGAELIRENKWYLEWLEFGIGERLAFPEFELFMVEERNDYSLWSVRFRMVGAKFTPISVTRADW